jgi:CubicO group peptidase (beta-lactamase class C family)
MTKPVTSVAVMMLFEDGKLALDDPVSKYIPEFANPKVVAEKGPRPASREITIRDLLTHTSGLGYDNTEKIGGLYTKAGIESGVCRSSVSLDKNIRRLAGIPLLFDPGEQFNYGMSTDVLGLVVERASGMKLDEFIEKRICEPLGMDDTFFHVPAEKRGRLAATFVADGTDGAGLRELGDSEQIRNSIWRVRMSPDHAFAPSHRYISGGGGLSSTAEDYLRFCQMILNDGKFDGVTVLKPTTVNMMTTNQIGHLDCGQLEDAKLKFGFGFAVFPGRDGMHGEISWGGIWGTVFRISKDGDWVGILLTQRVFDETFPQREIDFVRVVREAIQGSGER